MTKPYYEHKGITIYHGNCLDILPELPQVDLVLTDPPYEAEAHTLQRRAKRAGGVLEVEPLTFSPMDEETRINVSKFISQKAKRWILIFCQIEAAPTWRSCLEENGMNYKRTCIWVKPDGMPQYSGDRPGMGYETILAMHVQGRSEWNGGGVLEFFTITKMILNGRKRLIQQPNL